MSRTGGAAEQAVADRYRERWAGRRLADAVVTSYELLEQSQNADVSALIADHLVEARGRGWAEVEVMLHYALHARILMEGGGAAAELGRLRAAADASDDVALVALGLATAAELPQGPADHRSDANASKDSDEADGLLARAVALLDDGGGSPVHRPTAYVACALGYKTRGLWELEEEMYAHAAQGLRVSLPAPLGRTQELTGRVVLLNRFDAIGAGACALLELGEREAAADLARGRLEPSRDQLVGVPQRWATELAAVRSLLAAISGEPETQSPEAILAGLQGSLWPEYRGFTLLGKAVRRLDAGDVAAAAALAERALEELDLNYAPTAHTLALALAAGAAPAPAALRYATQLARLRWQTRMRVLGSARARLTAERVMLENERLSQRAYVAELTGLANRHAYVRPLSRRRRSPPEHELAVLMVDIDHFKAVNDRHGHAVGDDVLRRVAALLAENARPGDLVARLGGDEFVMILDLARPLDAASRGRRLVEDAARHPWEGLTAGLAVGLSIGLATGPAVGVEALLAAADRCLYAAKAGGRGRLVDREP